DSQGYLDKARSDSRVRRVKATAVASLKGGESDRQPLGNVLQPDGPHEGEGLADVARTETHADGQPLRQVVEGNRHDKEEHSGRPAGSPLTGLRGLHRLLRGRGAA